MQAAGVSAADIQRSARVLSEWLKTNSGDVASQFGITVQQLRDVIGNYENAFTTGVTQVMWIGAAFVLAGAVLAFITFRPQRKAEPLPSVTTEQG